MTRRPRPRSAPSRDARANGGRNSSGESVQHQLPADRRFGLGGHRRLGGYGYFGETFPRATLDAAIGRQLLHGERRLPTARRQRLERPGGHLRSGNNGVATADDVREMVESVPSDKYVYLINVRSPDPPAGHQQPASAASGRRARQRAHHRLARRKRRHDEYFDGDGTHSPASTGARRTWRLQPARWRSCTPL